MSPPQLPQRWFWSQRLGAWYCYILDNQTSPHCVLVTRLVTRQILTSIKSTYIGLFGVFKYRSFRLGISFEFLGVIFFISLMNNWSLIQLQIKSYSIIIGKNNNTHTVQAESSKFASVWPEIPNMGWLELIGTPCQYFALIRLYLALLYIMSIPNLKT